MIGDPMPVNRIHVLEDFLKAYKFQSEDVCVNEFVANAMDAFKEYSVKNRRVKISFAKKSGDNYIVFHNNAPPMDKDLFAVKYHEIAGSTKTAGESVGFAGVGAKVFLANSPNSEIITVTGKDSKNFYASKMFRTKNDMSFATSIKYTLQEVLGNFKIDHTYGTTCWIKLTPESYKYLKTNIVQILQFWFNSALMNDLFEIFVEGKKIKSWIPKGKRKSKSFQWNNKKINCEFFISDDEIHESGLHLIFTVFGKRIINEKLDLGLYTKLNYSKRIFAIIDATVLAKHLTVNKEDFKGIPVVGAFKNRAQEQFWKFLDDENLLKSNMQKDITRNESVNYITQKLNKLLQSKKFKDFNPFLTKRQREIPSPDKTGKEKISVVEGFQKTGKNAIKKGEGGNVGDITGDGHAFDDKGEHSGSSKIRHSRGLQIIEIEYDEKEESREAFVSIGHGAIVINTGHRFFKKMQTDPSLNEFNTTRIIVEALIEFPNESEAWSAKETFEKSRELLHAIWN